MGELLHFQLQLSQKLDRLVPVRFELKANWLEIKPQAAVRKMDELAADAG